MFKSFFHVFLGNLRLVEAVSRAFVVYHAAVSDRLLPDHVNYTSDNRPSNLFNQDTADPNYSLLNEVIKLYSRESDWILDINSAEG